MALSFEDELRLDAEEDAREARFIREQLPADLKEAFSENDILWLMDAIVDDYATSGILDAEPDKDGYVNLNLREIADRVAAKAAHDGQGRFDPEAVFFVVQADWDFQEQQDL